MKNNFHITEFFDIVENKNHADKFNIRIKNVNIFDGFEVEFKHIKILDGDFEDDEDINLELQYETIERPEGFDEESLTDQDRLFFENMLNDIFVYLLKIQLDQEQLEFIGTDDIKKSDTE